MGMLEEECKRRACIEQASIQRIKDLEAQVCDTILQIWLIDWKVLLLAVFLILNLD